MDHDSEEAAVAGAGGTGQGQKVPTSREPGRSRLGASGVASRAGRHVLVIGPALAWAVFFVLPLAPGQAGPGVAMVLLTVAVVPLLLLRRRAPLGVAAAAAVLLLAGPGMWLTALVALVSVAVRRSAQRTLAAGVLILAGHAVGGWPQQPPGGALAYLVLGGWVPILGGALVLAATAGSGLYLGARRQLLASAQDRAARAEAEQAQRAQQARERERACIAREMHDVLAHRLSMLSLHAGALEYRSDVAGVGVAEAAGVIRDNAHQALQELREVLGVLRAEPVTGSAAAEVAEPAEGASSHGPERLNGATAPDEVDADEGLRPQPSLAQVGELVLQAAAGATAVGMRLEGDVTAVAPVVGRAVYRVVQEGLTNARKHAPGAQVSTCIAVHRDGVRVEVDNTAASASQRSTREQPPGSGTGLVGIAERAALLGGRVEHGPTPEGGYALRVWLPLSSHEVA